MVGKKSRVFHESAKEGELKLTETLEKCPNCGSVFFKWIPSRAELFARLDGSESKYVYCKEECLKHKLENTKAMPFGLGSISISIKNETRIEKTDKSPVIYIIDFASNFPKVEGTHVS